MRDQELRHARAQIEQRPWARQSHVYLMGLSEGGLATAWTTSAAFRARIVLGSECGSVNGGHVRGPRTQPALALIADRDQYVQPHTGRVQKCAVNGHPLSSSRYIRSMQHDLTTDPKVLRLIDRFLRETGT